MAFGVDAQNYASITSCVTNPPDFSQLSYEEESQAVMDEQEKTICPEYITNLVNQLQQETLGNDKKVLVIYLLGELRVSDTNSIEVLIKYINLKATKIEPKLSAPRWGYYPAQEALIKIGTPVVNPILNHLPNEGNELRGHLMFEALIRIEGKKGSIFNEPEGKKIVQDQIKDKLASESDPSKRANLDAALRELTK